MRALDRLFCIRTFALSKREWTEAKPERTTTPLGLSCCPIAPYSFLAKLSFPSSASFLALCVRNLCHERSVHLARLIDIVCPLDK